MSFAGRIFRRLTRIAVLSRKRVSKRRMLTGVLFLQFLLVMILHSYWSSGNVTGPVQPPVDSNYTRALHRKLIDIVSGMRTTTEGPVLLTIVNKGYLTFTYNWLCHTAGMKGVHENLIFMVQGEDTELQLKRRWPSVKTITVNQTTNELGESLVFGTVGYVRMMVRRTDLLNSLIQSNISFVLFETDFIWFENPVPDLIRMGNEQDLDIVGTISTAPNQLMCGALIYFRNTTRTRALWGEVTRKTQELGRSLQTKGDGDKAPLRQNEQIYMNQLLGVGFAHARYGLVDYGIVVDGKWYDMKKMEKKQLRPRAIHNNFLETAPEKLDRFHQFRQWVLDDDDESCNATKVKDIFERGPT